MVVCDVEVVAAGGTVCAGVEATAVRTQLRESRPRNHFVCNSEGDAGDG